MRGYIWRAARRSLDSPNVREARRKAQAKPTARLQSTSHTDGSHDYDHFGWRAKLVSRFAQLQVVNALRRGEREQASMMLLNLGHASGCLTAQDFSYILEYCADTADPLFVLETWKVMEQNAIDPNKSCCRSIIQAFTKGGYLKEALNWLAFLGENDRVCSSLSMFNIFLSVCGSTHNRNYAEACLEKMESHLLGKSEITYWELLKLAVLQKNLSAVYEIWEDCTRYYNPSIITLRKFIQALTRLGDLESAHKTLQYMVTLAGQNSATLTVSAKRRYQSSRLDIPIPAMNDLSGLRFFSHANLPLPAFQVNHEKQEVVDFSHSEIAFNELDKVESEFYIESTAQMLEKASIPTKNFLRWSYNDMIHACARFNNCQLAEQLFLQMREVGLLPSRYTYDGFVKAVITGKGVTYGMKVVESMEKKNIELYNDTLAALSIGHSRNLDLDLAESCLEKLSDSLPKFINPFNALLAACDVMNEPERAVRIVARIKHFNIKLNIRTYELMFSLFANVNVPYEKGNMLSHADVARRIHLIEMDMLKNGIQHSFVSMKNLIRAVGAEGMIQEMLRYLNVAENMLWHIDPYQNSDMYNTVLHALVKSKDTHTAIRVFKNMRACGLPANVAIYNIMIECCSMLTCFRSACALLSLMYRDGFCPQTLTYTALMKVLLANEEFDGAMSLLDKAKDEGIQLDVQLFNTILREAYAKGRLHIIEHVIERMHREKIQPDPSTLWYTFSAYVECELHTTAMEALQVLSIRMISEDILCEKRASLEDLVHSEDPDAELKIINAFKASEEFLATALLNLRWCAVLGSSISWSPEESFWARRLAASYGSLKGPYWS
ncbi:pentatricopeptide repeat-containing protein At1g76280 isoform X1 [Ananas comosus]|uniref:Pentatricopeptide repeat-containing protein At1g76280 isoform X1 n=1 Tax=Ananas comosus TaxID=4615 RepID=A0A6P5EJF5_ANACO|nr:pentatricopeptide repeat-containing protein At1g76280 isoform X1 [Ananas comosus]